MAKAKTPGRRPQTGAGPQTVPAAQTIAVDAPAPKKKTSPGQFFSQVRAEGRKITWPSRKETWITSVMVFIMVLIASIFFWIVDTGLGFAFRYIIALGS
ncbi:preprotein translocase subunit SecE [uncultured Brevundimonas sp.]|uniref:preprotein translocase subunit SecE n=1 Tax=uncultured Brevundimonas sp. TaxID=213418 RepID=UPI0025D18B10|nr:preprotein translocase subunit SecE [uncultured Brevundimonas sp.]